MKHFLLIIVGICCFSFVQAQFIVKKTVDCKCWYTSSGIYIDTVWHRESVNTHLYRVDHILDSTAYFYNDTLSGENKTLKYYDIYGRDSLHLYIFLDTAIQQWEIGGKKEFSYFPNGDKDVVSFFWRNGQWIYNSRVYSLYQNSNLLQEKYFYNYDTLMQTWNIPYKEIYYYSVQNQLSEVHSMSWNDTISQYEVSGRNLYIYNTQSSLDSLVYQRYHSSSSSWESRSILVYDYDTNGDTASIQYFLFYANQWGLMHYYEYVYNGNQLDTIRNYQDIPSSPNEALARTIFEYGNVGLNEIDNKLDIKAYPNPASENILIESSEIMQRIELYDMQGKMLYAVNNQAALLMDVSAYPSGIYILQIKTDRGLQHKKIIVSR